MNRLLAVVSGLLLAGSVAWADGIGPGREMTGPEALAYQEVHDTIQKALPKAPEGYAFEFKLEGERAEGEVPEGIGPSEMFQIRFLATYTLEQDNSAEAAQAALMERAKGTPEQQAKMAELEAKAAELKKARDDAGSRAEKDQIRAQLKSVQAEENQLQDEIMAQFQAWMASGGATAVQQSAAASVPAKLLTVRAMINSTVSVIDTATPYKIEGFPLAFERSEGCDDVDTYCITVFLGPFAKADKISGRDRYRLPEDSPGVPTKARGIALTFAGPKDKPESVRELLRKTNLEILKPLVG
jgi:hypothetical protein